MYLWSKIKWVFFGVVVLPWANETFAFVGVSEIQWNLYKEGPWEGLSKFARYDEVSLCRG